MIGNPIDRIRGRSAYVLTRSSSRQQTTSNKNQGRTVEGLIKEADLAIEGQTDLYGVTGSVPGARDDIDLILRDKRSGGRFDLLVVPDVTRFTRAGQTHRMHLLHELRRAGIDVFFNAENLLVSDRMSEMYLSWLLMAANETARAISRGANIGRYQRFDAGKSTHTNRIPYGVDRLYRDPSGKPMHVVRNLADGRQVLLDPQTQEVVREFPPNTAREVNHFAKQKSDSVEFIPGDPERVATLLWMFEAHYAERWNFNQIARRLNDDGVAGLGGGPCYHAAVRHTLRNPVYTGTGVRYRLTGAAYTVACEGEPRPSDVSYQELNDNPRAINRPRSPDEWKRVRYGALEDFLPEHIREPARLAAEAQLEADKLRKMEREAQRKTAESQGIPYRPKPHPHDRIARDKHGHTLYLLKNILTNKQTGLPMTGRTTGKKPTRTRSYAIARAKAAPRTEDAVLRRLVPAEQLEREVLRELRDALLDGDIIREAVAEELQRLKLTRDGPVSDTAALQKQIKKLRHGIANLADHLDPDAGEDDPVRRKQETYRRQLCDLQRKLTIASNTKTPLPTDPALVAEWLIAELERAVYDLPLNPQADNYPRLRALLEVFVVKAEADLDTKAVHVEFAMPIGLIERAASLDPTGPGNGGKPNDGGNPGPNPPKPPQHGQNATSSILPPLCLVAATSSTSTGPTSSASCSPGCPTSRRGGRSAPASTPARRRSRRRPSGTLPPTPSCSRRRSARKPSPSRTARCWC